jgi:mannose-6-phosphate isomerase class I
MNPTALLQLIPEYRDYLWGGQQLRPGQLTAEAWVIYDASDRIAAGPLAGRTLAEVAAQDAIGPLGAPWPSLQIHPDDEAAVRLDQRQAYIIPRWYIEGWSVDEIAAETRLEVNHIYLLKHRGLKKLREYCADA